MQTLTYCLPEQFCINQKETGGEYGVPLQIWCMADSCCHPDKRCVFVEKGGKRPVRDI